MTLPTKKLSDLERYNRVSFIALSPFGEPLFDDTGAPFYSTPCVVVEVDKSGQIDLVPFLETGPMICALAFTPHEMEHLENIHTDFPLALHDINIFHSSRNMTPKKDNLMRVLRSKGERIKSPWFHEIEQNPPTLVGRTMGEVITEINAKRNRLHTLGNTFILPYTTIGWERFCEAYKHVHDHASDRTDMPPDVQEFKNICDFFEYSLEVFEFRGDWFLCTLDETYTTASQETLEALAQEFPTYNDYVPVVFLPPVVKTLDEQLEELLSETPKSTMEDE